MAKCMTCNNNYDKTFNIAQNDQIYTFDCFECAIHLLAPVCKYCQCKIIGHGIEAEGCYYCCVNCAREEGVTQAKDRV